MTERCVDLDEFFDGELAADQADAFRAHLTTCERCQDVLHGRMQENVVARVALDRTAPATAPSVATPRVVPIAQARRGCVRALAYAAPILAAAAAVPLWLIPRNPEFQLSVAFERAEPVQRGLEPADPTQPVLTGHVGDVARPRVQGERYQAIWVYLDGRKLVVACPKDDAGCSTAGGGLTLTLRLAAHGKYTIVALGSSEPIPVPRATLDDTLVFVRTTGIHNTRRDIRVD